MSEGMVAGRECTGRVCPLGGREVPLSSMVAGVAPVSDGGPSGIGDRRIPDLLFGGCDEVTGSALVSRIVPC